MGSDEPAKPGPVVLRIKLRYEDVDTMVHRFAPNVGKSGLFLPTRSLQAVGAEIKFELRLANDTPVLVGHGRVKLVREPDPKQPKASFGMAVELLRVTRESREVILRMLERRKTLGLPEVAIPMPEDLEVAVAAVKADSGPVLTAPRRASGPMAIAKETTVPALAPEPPRKPRPVIGELIARASGPIAMAAIPELDENVDVAAAIARAHVLAAGTDLDAELDAIRDSAAAPIEISIEAASAELARQLGGLAVVRRSAGWVAPPPVVESRPAPAAAVVEPEPAPEPVVSRTRSPVIEGEQLDALLAESEPRHDPEVLEARSRERRLHLRARTRSRNFERPPSPAPVAEEAEEELAVSEAEVVGETVLANMPAVDAEPDEPEVLQSRPFVPAGVDDIATDPHAELGMPGPMIDDNVDPEQFVAQHSGEHELLDDADLEEVEHTQLGEVPVDPDAFAAHAYATEPAFHDHEALANSLDAQLAEAEQEAVVDPELSDEEEAEELDDFEILAEADADDADLLAAHGEADAGASEADAGASELEPEPEPEPEPDEPEPEPLPRPSEADFVARLDFGGEVTPPPSDPLAGFDRDSLADFGLPDDEVDQGFTRRRRPSQAYDEQLPAFDLPDDEPGTPAVYDIPAIEEDDFHERRAARPMQISVRTNVVSPDETYNEPPDEPQYLSTPPQDLDDALEALDVDLDESATPPPGRRPTPGVARVAHRAGTPAAKLPRAPSEDGILIDFGDDDD